MSLHSRSGQGPTAHSNSSTPTGAGTHPHTCTSAHAIYQYRVCTHTHPDTHAGMCAQVHTQIYTLAQGLPVPCGQQGARGQGRPKEQHSPRSSRLSGVEVKGTIPQTADKQVSSALRPRTHGSQSRTAPGDPQPPPLANGKATRSHEAGPGPRSRETTN